MYKKIVAVVLSVIMIIPTISITHAEESLVTNSASIVVFAHFTNDTQNSADTYFNNMYQTYKNYFVGDYGRSFKNYLNTVSYGKHQKKIMFPQEVAGKISSIPLTISQDDAKNNNVDGIIMDTILNRLSTMNINNSDIDLNNDGYVDNVIVILKAEKTSVGVDSGTLVPHSNTNGILGKFQGLNVMSVNMLNTERLNTEKTGLIIHEYLHTLGYPDLYRGSLPNDYPVYLWDIMGSVSEYPTYPLAYLRSKITNWFSIDTISKNGTYTLDSQSNKDGNKAFIIKSPLNDTEEFVVEYRQRPKDITDNNTLDRILQGSGIIVYRINKRVDKFANDGNETGVYIFRPQKGQNGYVENNEAVTLVNAYLSKESGRTSIGSSDLSSTLQDGALTFSDGSNSGIVISNVGSSSGDSISFDLSFPDLTTSDLWKNTNFNTTIGRYNRDISTAYIDDIMCAVEYNGSSFIYYEYQDDSWKQITNELAVSSYGGTNQMKLFKYNNNTYFMYYDYEKGFVLKKIDKNTNQWNDVTIVNHKGNYFDIGVINNELYLSYLDNEMGKNAYLAKFNGSTFDDLGIYYASVAAGGLQKIVSYNDTPYVFIREAKGDKLIGFKNENNQFVKVLDGSIIAKTFDCYVYDNKLYISTVNENNKLQICIYDGNKWETHVSQIDSYESTMTMINGHIYVLSSPSSGSESFKMYLYEDDVFIQEGDTSIDSSSRYFNVIPVNNEIYLSYVRNSDQKSFIKRKTININNLKKKNLTNTTISKTDNGYEVKYVDTLLTEGIDYKLEKQETDDSCIISISALGNGYEGSKSKIFKNISKLDISCPNVTFTGVTTTNVVKVHDGNKELVEGIDYKLNYSNNTSPGRATVTIIGIGDYYGDSVNEFIVYEETGESFGGYALDLQGKIGFNFYFKLDDDLKNDKGAYLLFNLPDGTQLKKYVKDAKEYNGKYLFSCGLSSVEMTQKVNFNFYRTDGRCSKQYSYAIIDYANELFALEGTNNGIYDKPIKAVKSMLNYGGYAQELFKNNLDNLANNGVKNEFLPELNQLTVNDLSDSKYDLIYENDNEDISNIGMSLEMQSTTSIRVYFNLKSGKSIDDYTFLVDGKKVKPYQASGNRYCIIISNIISTKLDEVHTINLAGKIMKCSALSYAKLALNYSAASDELKNTVKALCLYSKYSQIAFKN